MNYYLGHLMPKANSLEKSLTLGKIEGKNENEPAKDEMARQHIEKQRHYFVKKGPSSQGYGFSCGHVWM